MIPLVAAIIISLVTTTILIKPIMRFFYKVGLVSLDLHKENKPKLPASGGSIVILGVLAGMLVYIGLQTFIYRNYSSSLHLLVAISSILIVTFSGLLDDLNVKSKPRLTKDGKNIKVGIPQLLKPLLVLPAAVPLMVINVGETMMSIPFVGDVNFGILYPLMVVPIGVVGASNMVNMLGGFNGVEAGMGAVYTFGLGIYALTHGSGIATIIFFSTFASLLPFLKYNWYPARLLPGDSLTYLLGVIVAVGVIIGNMERVGIIVMTPFILQGLLKFYSRFRLGNFASDLGVLQKDGTIKPKYGKIYSITHIVMRLGNFREKQITLILILIQVAFTVLPFVI